MKFIKEFPELLNKTFIPKNKFELEVDNQNIHISLLKKITNKKGEK